MELTTSRNGIPIRLSDERWSHIIRRHPEMDGCWDMVIETLAMPDLIQAGDSGELLAVRLYDKTTLGRKYVVVAYRETSATDGFILTAYLTRRPSQQREVLWTR
ncbi:hypothetical protein [Sphaerothrix gracilis]|uniref:hypothetical protein n=1 Tax=Sphaerothrix gracilis TaxID=3151835 RepID=UPI0031FDDA0B